MVWFNSSSGHRFEIMSDTFSKEDMLVIKLKNNDYSA